MPRSLERVERAAAHLAAERDRDQANRADLLWAHATLGIFAGVSILAFGLAANLELYVGAWTRGVVGWLGIVGGLTLAWALRCRTHTPRPHLEAAGLTMLIVWDVCLAVGFAWAVVLVPPALTWWWESTPRESARPYPVWIYLAMLLMLRIHLRAGLDHWRRANEWKRDHP